MSVRFFKMTMRSVANFHSQETQDMFKRKMQSNYGHVNARSKAGFRIINQW
jgi:hypothetical protein